MKFLLDSNIIIYHLNGDNIASEFITKNIDQCSISRITFVEVLSFDFDENEASNIKDFLNCFHIFDTSTAIAIQCLKNRKTKKIKIPDNFIASTAQVNGLVLVTRNTEDFYSLDIEILNIFN